MSKGYLYYILGVTLLCIISLKLLYNINEKNKQLSNDNIKLSKNIDDLKISLLWDAKLKENVNIIFKRSPAVGGMIEDIKNDIDNASLSDKMFNNIKELPTTDHEIILKERVLNNGLNKYLFYYNFFNYPVSDIKNCYISSEYGRNYIYIQGKSILRLHRGVDIVAKFDLSILAVCDGTIIEIGTKKDLGNYIVVQHIINNKRYRSIYGHLFSVAVNKFEKVKQGDIIGLMGTTGNSTGVHLHFELHEQDNYTKKYYTINPFYISTYSIPVELSKYVPLLTIK